MLSYYNSLIELIAINMGIIPLNVFRDSACNGKFLLCCKY